MVHFGNMAPAGHQVLASPTVSRDLADLVRYGADEKKKGPRRTITPRALITFL